MSVRLCLALLACLAPQAWASQATGSCGDTTACLDLGSFTVTVTDVRKSFGFLGDHFATVNFQIKSTAGRPLALAFVNGSGSATDDRGNRYAVASNSLRGLGTVVPTSVDVRAAAR